MAEPDQQHMMIFDDPESKIHFLEETLADEDWRATIVYPDDDAQSGQSRADVKATLENRGILVKERVDEHGHHLLDLHHAGEGTRFSDLTRELGLATGTMHAFRHPRVPLSGAIEAGKKLGHWLNKSLHDPAQANGLINTSAEIFLTAAGGGGSKYGKWHDAKNVYQTIAGLSWLSQSLTYLFIAKNNEDTALGHFAKKVETTLKSGGDITQITYDPVHDKEPEGVGHSIVKFLRRYPVQIGAVMNDLGMVFYLRHAVLEKRWRQGLAVKTEEDLNYIRKGFTSGFGHDVGGALTSLFGWLLMLVPPKKQTEKEQDAASPAHGLFAQAWDHFRDNPQQAAGLVTFAASGQRLLGAHSKSNGLQKVGESIYIFGDFALMATNSHEYGGNQVNAEKLSDHLAGHINALPLVMGHKAQTDFIEHTTAYLLDKNKEMNAKKPAAEQLTTAELEARAKILTIALGRKVRHVQDERLEHIGEIAVVRLIERFPEAAHAEPTARLSTTIAHMPWVHITPEELHLVLDKEMRKQPQSSPQSKLVQMRDIKQDVAELVHVIPDIDKGATAGSLYDAVTPFIRPHASDKHQLTEAVGKKIGALVERVAVHPAGHVAALNASQGGLETAR